MKNSNEVKKKTTRKRKTIKKYRAGKEILGYPIEDVADKRMLHLVEDLIEGAQSGRYTSLNKFRSHNLIPFQTWRDWCSAYPYVKAANDLAKEAIGSYRIDTAMKKGCDSKLISDNQLSFYCPEYAQHLEWAKKLDSDNRKDVNVIITPVDQYDA